jgi:chromate transporter
MMLPLLKRRDPVALVMLVAVFVAVGVLRWPLPQVLLATIPLSIAVTWLARRRKAA